MLLAMFNQEMDDCQVILECHRDGVREFEHNKSAFTSELMSVPTLNYALTEFNVIHMVL